MDLSRLKKAEMLLGKGKLKEAESLLLKFVNKHKQVKEAWMMLASIYGQTGRYDQVVAVCNKVVALNPDDPMARSLLGSAYVFLNRHEEAIEHLQLAQKLVPGNPGIMNNLANAFYAMGKTAEAESWYRATLGVDENHPQANFGLGNCCLAQSLWGEAVQHYLTAYNAMSDNYEINMSLGKAYVNLARLDESMESLHRAVKLTRQPSNAYYGLAHTALLKGSLEEAQGYIAQSLQHQPDNVDARAEQAEIQYRMGNIEEAHKQVRELVDNELIFPAVVLTWSNLCRHFGECPEVIEHAQSLLANERVAKSDKVSLYYKLGKLYDMSGDFDRAFYHYDQGNHLIPNDFDRNYHAAMITNLIENFRKDKIESLPHTSCTDERPVFIIGMPRSGTSLVEQILSSHPDIFGAGELNDIKELVCQALADTVSSDELNRFGAFNVKKLDELAESYLAKIGEMGGIAKRVTDKMPANFIWLGFIQQLFPNARIIHCQRDPRDSCLSIFFQEFSRGGHQYANDLGDIASYYSEYQRLMAHWQSVLKLPVIEVKYSELVADFEGEVRKMIDFLDLDWDERCLDFHKSERTTATASWDQVRQSVYTKSLDRWKHYRNHLKPLLDQFGDDDQVKDWIPAPTKIHL